MNQPIFHLATAADAQALTSNGTYHTASLDTEGFIHCCTATQLSGVIQRYYADAQEAVILSIDSTLLSAELVFENTVGGDELFPHIYGEINQQAIQGIETMNRQRLIDIATSGTFSGLKES